MQFKLSFATLALATLAAATVTPVRRTGTPASQCNTGPVQCCNSTSTASTPLYCCSSQGITSIVGLTCTPITVIGAGSNSYTAQPVCCTNNSFNGVVALGCSPVNLGL